MQVQPSEFAKLALALWAADVLVRKGEQAGAWRELSRPLFPVAGLLLVLVGYNDLGTMLCLLVLFVGMLWAAGVRMRVFAAVGAAALAGIVALIYLPGNQYRHGPASTGFLHPELSQLGDGVPGPEGLFAIANGGWFGVGLGEGRLKWGWLPNGAQRLHLRGHRRGAGRRRLRVVLALFGVLAYTGLRIARRVTHPFRRLVAAGITTLSSARPPSTSAAWSA